MRHLKFAETTDELEGILQLQRQNLAANLSPEEAAREGFVTVVHRFPDLKALNDLEQHVIAVDGTKVIAYLLAMTKQSADLIPVLQPMFDLFHRLPYRHQTVSDFHYLVVGQVCVDKAYRGTGLLDDCYRFYQQSYRHRYAFAVTEIAAANQRSFRAHQRIGFEEIDRYTTPGGVEWIIVVWDWEGKGSIGR